MLQMVQSDVAFGFDSWEPALGVQEMVEQEWILDLEDEGGMGVPAAVVMAGWRTDG